MKVKEESEKAGLKLNIQKMKIMASGPITSWQIDGETMETVTDFLFLGSKITADGHWSHEMKRGLLPERKAVTNLDSILKGRDITLPTKIRIVKAVVSLVAQMVKNLPAMQETWVWSLGWEDPLEEDMATHSSILAWRFPMDRGAWQVRVHGVAKSQTWLSD